VFLVTFLKENECVAYDLVQIVRHQLSRGQAGK